jgi:sugar (pentulose or hexulose) kinase
VSSPRFEWSPAEPAEPARRFRAALEAIAYLIALGVGEHEDAGRKVTRITVSGGIARSDLMCRILASVLDRPLVRLASFEGPALGVAVAALAALETHLRRKRRISAEYTLADAVERMVKFRDEVKPEPAWCEYYREGLRAFERALQGTPAPVDSNGKLTPAL